MRTHSGDYHVKLNNIQSESELTEDRSITNAVMEQDKIKWIWTAGMEDQLVDLWQQHECLYSVSCKTYKNHSKHYHRNFFLPIIRHVYSEVSRDFARFPVFTVRLKICSCVVCCLCHIHSTPHTIGAKRLNLGFFVLGFVVSHILKIF